MQSRRNWKRAVHTLAASHIQTHRSTGEQHDSNQHTHQNRNWNFICRLWNCDCHLQLVIFIFTGKRHYLCFREAGRECAGRGMPWSEAEEEGNFESLCLSRWQTSVSAVFPLGECRLYRRGLATLALWPLIPEPIVLTVWSLLCSPGYRLELHCVTLDGVSN